MIRELKYCTDFGDVNEELREIYDRFPKLSTDASGNVTGLVDPTGGNPYGFAVLPKDANGNAIANIVPRTGLLADLLALDGGVGEVSSATDTRSIVRHTGVAGEAYEINAHQELTYAGNPMTATSKARVAPVAGTTVANYDGAWALGLNCAVVNSSSTIPIKYSAALGFNCYVRNSETSLALGSQTSIDLESAGNNNVAIASSVVGANPSTVWQGVKMFNAYVDDLLTTVPTTVQGTIIGCRVSVPDGGSAGSTFAVFGGDPLGGGGDFTPPLMTGTYFPSGDPTKYVWQNADMWKAVGIRTGSTLGTFDQSYQRVTSGTALAVTGGSVIVDFAGAADLTLTLPASPIDGQNFEVSNQVAFSAGNIVVNPNATPAGQTIVLNTLATPAAGVNAAWRYVQAANKWCRIR